MADTIITTPRDESGAGAAGWAVAVVVLIAVIFGGLYFLRNGKVTPDAATPSNGASINVTLPTSGNDNGNTGGTQY